VWQRFVVWPIGASPIGIASPPLPKLGDKRGTLFPSLILNINYCLLYPRAPFLP
jgi:hypothetical protein